MVFGTAVALAGSDYARIRLHAEAESVPHLSVLRLYLLDVSPVVQAIVFLSRGAAPLVPAPVRAGRRGPPAKTTRGGRDRKSKDVLSLSDCLRGIGRLFALPGRHLECRNASQSAGRQNRATRSRQHVCVLFQRPWTTNCRPIVVDNQV